MSKGYAQRIVGFTNASGKGMFSVTVLIISGWRLVCSSNGPIFCCCNQIVFIVIFLICQVYYLNFQQADGRQTYYFFFFFDR